VSGPTARIREARLALMLLTRLPAGRLAEAPSLADARWAYPLAGLAVGALGWAAFAAAAALGLPPAAAALLSLAATALATGALHEDGLADYADGAGAGGDRARRLEIMADSRLGSYGALALLVSAGLRAVALATLAPPLWAFLAIAAASRAAMLGVQEALPPARPGGLGAAARGRDGERGSGVWRTPAGLALGLAALLPLGAAGLAAGLAMAAAAAALARHARARLGGQTGDVLGAAQQLAEVAGWLALLALAGNDG
jgi:adenosylcobinamide-GDP ribazoletransferase